jgi:hypothetical protein
MISDDWISKASKVFSNYIKWYTTETNFIQEKAKEHKYNDPDFEFYKISIIQEKSIYLRFWEADTTLFYLYQLTRLGNKQPYDWKWKQLISQCNSRQEFYRVHIKEQLKNADNTILNFLIANVNRQIRNAIAHSQYCLLNNVIKYLNYSTDPKKYAPLITLKYSEWEDIIHNTLIFRNELVNNLNNADKCYKLIAEYNYKNVPFRIVKDDSSIEFRNFNLR